MRITANQTLYEVRARYLLVREKVVGSRKIVKNW